MKTAEMYVLAQVNGKIYYSKDLCALHQHIEKAKSNVCKRLQITFSSRNYYYREWSGYHGLKLYILLVSKKIQQLIYDY